MKHFRSSFEVVLFCIVFGCLLSGVALELQTDRTKRQAADVKTAEYLARWALERPPEGCVEIGCGLVDLVVSGKKKKSTPEHFSRLPNGLPSRILSVLMQEQKDE